MQDGGVEHLLNTIQLCYAENRLKLYFYGASAIQALIFNGDQVTCKHQVAFNSTDWVMTAEEVQEEFVKHNTASLLCKHVVDLWKQEDELIDYFAPVILTLGSLIQARKEFKKQMTEDKEFSQALLEIASNKKVDKNLQLSSLILLCQMQVVDGQRVPVVKDLIEKKRE